VKKIISTVVLALAMGSAFYSAASYAEGSDADGLPINGGVVGGLLNDVSSDASTLLSDLLGN
jgi:hypothetical protein